MIVDFFKEVFDDVDDFDINDVYTEIEETSVDLTDENLGETEIPK